MFGNLKTQLMVSGVSALLLLLSGVVAKLTKDYFSKNMLKK